MVDMFLSDEAKEILKDVCERHSYTAIRKGDLSDDVYTQVVGYADNSDDIEVKRLWNTTYLMWKRHGV